MENLRIKSVVRTKEIIIKLNGKPIKAFEGETVLAAILATGTKIIRRSSVLNEPRGGLCGMGVCYDCLVTIDGIPNLRACMSYVKDGMEVETDE